MKNLGILYIHGMGDEPEENIYISYKEKFIDKVKSIVGQEISRQIEFDYFFYHDLITGSQKKLWDVYKQSLNHQGARNLFLTGFSDAVSVDLKENYFNIQARFAQKLDLLKYKLSSEQTPIIVIAHSLGVYVFNNYLWDAQMYELEMRDRTQSIWGNIPFKLRYSLNEINDENKSFYQLKTLKSVFSIGCNLPIIVGGRNSIQSVYNNNLGYDFKWFNFHGENDILGWPLSLLGVAYNQDQFGASYSDLVKDYKVKITNSIIPDNPLTWGSHIEYFSLLNENNEFRKEIINEINNCLNIS